MAKGDSKRRKRIREKLYLKQGSFCAICGGRMQYTTDSRVDINVIDKDYVTIEHIIPVSLGGTNKQSNLCVVHSVCNTYRGLLDFEEYKRDYGSVLFEWFKTGFDKDSKPKLPNPMGLDNPEPEKKPLGKYICCWCCERTNNPYYIKYTRAGDEIVWCKRCKDYI